MKTEQQTLIPEIKALELLDSYQGNNNYILNLKQLKETNKKFYLTRSQADYIINYYELVPKVAKKWVDLDPYFAKKIADDKLMTTIPDKIWVEKLLVEKDKSYHIWGKLFHVEQNRDFWIPKAAIIKTQTIKEVKIDYLKYTSRPPLEHQKVAIEKLAGSKRFILADDMGLGKTTSAVIAALETEAKKVLIICPASLKINWKKEISNYTNRPIYIAEGKNFSMEHDFIILNYDIIKNFHSLNNSENSIIAQYNPDLIILDEAHYVSNSQASRTKLVNDFAKKTQILWLLTGTPMTNRPMNYFNLLQLIESPVAQNWMAFAIRYCEGHQIRIGKKKIWIVNGASNLEELRDRTSKQILRRLKTEILDLPEKIITPVYLKLNSKSYEDLMADYFYWYKNNSNESSSLTIQFSKLMKVRQVLADEKVKSTIEIAENIVEQGKKVIIFTNFTDSLNKIFEHFSKIGVKLDGSSTPTQRQNAVDNFQQNDKIKVFVGNMKASGVGITLTAAEAVIINDLSFVPGDMSQAEDRAYRIGQKKSVSVYYPIFENTIENIIYEKVNSKKQNIDTVMGDNINKADFFEEIMFKINSLV